MSEQQDFTVDLPKFKCHKIVRAAKIIAIDNGTRLDLMPHGVVEAGPSWIREKKAEVGGYYVVYDDGYASYSPAKAFEEGYTVLAADNVPPMNELTMQEVADARTTAARWSSQDESVTKWPD